MSKLNNPAGRLHQIITEAKRNEGLATRNMWAKVLDIEPTDSEVIKNVVAIYGLVEECKAILDRLDLPHKEIFLRPFPVIERVLTSINLDSNWTNASRSLDDKVMTGLEFCAIEISKHYSEESIGKKDLEEITSLVDELFQLTLESSIEFDVKSLLLEEVERIRAAISMYKISGAKGLKSALQSTLGMVYMNQDDLKAINAADHDILEKLGQMADKITLFTNRVLKLQRTLKSPFVAVLKKITDEKSETEKHNNEEVHDGELVEED